MRRRRVAALAITSLLAVGVIAGCGSSSSSSAAAGSKASASSSADTYTSVTATGAFGKAPTVTIPAKAGSGALYTKTLIQGTGPALTSSQSLLGNFVLYDWSGKTHKLLGSTYSDGVPTLFTALNGKTQDQINKELNVAPDGTTTPVGPNNMIVHC